MIHTTTAAALTDKAPGARTLQCPYPEALKLAGQPTVDVSGRPAWYSTPISYAPGQSRPDPLAIWNVGVVLDQGYAESSAAAARAA